MPESNVKHRGKAIFIDENIENVVKAKFIVSIDAVNLEWRVKKFMMSSRIEDLKEEKQSLIVEKLKNEKKTIAKGIVARFFYSSDIWFTPPSILIFACEVIGRHSKGYKPSTIW